MSESGTAAKLGDFEDDLQPYGRAATAWSRLWARLADVQILVFALAFLMGWLFPEFLNRSVFQDTGGYLLVFLLLPLVLVVDAFSQTAFGNTLGKLVAGLQSCGVRRKQSAAR